MTELSKEDYDQLNKDLEDAKKALAGQTSEEVKKMKQEVVQEIEQRIAQEKEKEAQAKKKAEEEKLRQAERDKIAAMEKTIQELQKSSKQIVNPADPFAPAENSPEGRIKASEYVDKLSDDELDTVEDEAGKAFFGEEGWSAIIEERRKNK